MLNTILQSNTHGKTFVTEPMPLILDETVTTINEVAWIKPYRSSDFPEITTTKDYFCLYSTDHSTQGGGAIYWGQMDDLNFKGFVESGKIAQTGYQSEFAWLIRIPTSESGLASETIFFYFHEASNPAFTITQETRLWTTTGGLLHTATWTDQGQPITPEAGDNHTGYLRIWKRGVGDYIGNHLIKGGGGLPYQDQQAVSTTPDGLNFTRLRTYGLYDDMPDDGSYFWRHVLDIFEWKGRYYTLLQYIDADSNKWISICAVNKETYLPIAIFYNQKITQLNYGDFEIFNEGGIVHIYLRVRNTTNSIFPVLGLYKLEFDLTEILLTENDYTFSVPTGNIVSYWNFDASDSTDQVGSNNGTDTSMSYGINGVVGKCADFTAGTSSNITVADDDTLSFGDGSTDSPFSVSFWVKYNSASISWFINKRDSSASPLEYQISYYLGKLRIQLFDQSSSGQLMTTVAWTPGPYWNHIVTTYDGSSQPKLYINTVEVGSASNSGTYTAMENTTAPLVIGKAAWTTTSSLDGYMDEIAIFDIELTQEQINDIYYKNKLGYSLTE